MYQLTINSNEYEIESINDLEKYLFESKKYKFSEIWLSKSDNNENDLKESSICVLKNQNLSFIVFSEDDNHYHSVNDLQKENSDEVEFELSNGQHDFYPKKFCVEMETAIKVLSHFYKFGEKSDLIEWNNN